MKTAAVPPPTTNHPQGGRGGLPPPSSLPIPTRPELRNIERGLRQGWEFPDNLYRALPTLMLELLTKRLPNQTYYYSDRTRVAAARVIALLNAQNQKVDPAPQTHLHAHAHEHRIRSVDERRQAFLARLDRPGE